MNRLFLILTLFSTAAFGGAVFFGSWRVQAEPGEIRAATINDSGNETGKYCNVESNHCVWYLTMPTSCKENSTFPALVNSTEGSSIVNFICLGSANGGAQYIYAFSDFDYAESLMKKALRVAFAFSLESDQFRIVRFKLDGSSTALNALDELSNEVLKTRSSGTKDQVM